MRISVPEADITTLPVDAIVNTRGHIVGRLIFVLLIWLESEPGRGTKVSFTIPKQRPNIQ
ncbi:MAG: hypothetical protein V2A66_03570 [Pseudomonadota bacterium]